MISFRSAEKSALSLVDVILLRTAMGAALLALILWYASLTVFQPGRVDAVVDTVLSSAHVQRETADDLYAQVKQFAPGAPMTKQAAKQIAKEMGDDPRTRQLLDSYATGNGTLPMGAAPGRDIDPKQVDAVFHSAVLRVDPQLAASLKGVHLHATPAGFAFTLSQVPSYEDANTIAAHGWPWLLLLALVLWVLAVVLSDAKPEVVRRLGRWLVWVAAIQVALLVVGPWLAVRYVTADWAAKYAAAATLWGSRVLVPIVVMGVIGVALSLAAAAWQRESHPEEQPAG